MFQRANADLSSQKKRTSGLFKKWGCSYISDRYSICRGKGLCLHQRMRAITCVLSVEIKLSALKI